MIPIIGTMMGLYIITRMLELISTTAKTHLRIFAVVTLVGSALGIGALIFGSSSPSDLFTTPNSSDTDELSDLLRGEDAPADFGSNTGWTISQTTNPIDDSPTVVLTLEAVSGGASISGRPTLILRCSQNETDAYVNWNEYLGSDRVSVTTRIGRNEAQTRRWSLSTDNTSTFYPDPPIQFILSLMSADTLVLRTTPYNESPVTAVFQVSGLGEKITPLQRACGWE